MVGYALELRGIVKQFGGKIVNESIDFAVMPGEIHGLIGENGAGKTTLMNVASGLYKQDEGHVFIEGQIHDHANPLDALKAGIAMVHQTFMMIDTLTVAENVSLGTKKGLGFISRAKQAREIAAVAEEFGVDLGGAEHTGLDWTHRLGKDLAPSEKQRVAILSALYRHSKVLILDEPTSVLSPEEIKSLFIVLRRLKSTGLAIVFISHKVPEVLEICDKVTVLRAGRVVGTAEASELDESSLATLIVGRTLNPRTKVYRDRGLVELLQVSDLWVKGDNSTWAVKGGSLSLHRGEVLGVAGVDGSGQHEFVECLAGLRGWERGSIQFPEQDSDGCALTPHVAYVPADPRREALLLDGDAAWNIGLRHADEPSARRMAGLLVNFGYLSRLTERIVEEFDVRNCKSTTRVADLSGGNLQKLLVGRELALSRNIVLIVNPTTGLDVGAIDAIWEQIIRIADEGAGVLLVSNELDELLALSDRIVVFYNGDIAGEVEGNDADREALGKLMSGVRIA
jgi:ABC-type uncharacterized transport system ATPase subunit